MTGKMHTPIYGYNQSVVADPSNTSESAPIRTNFITPEGIYRQMTVNEYFRTNRIPNQVAAVPVCNSPVRVSFLRIPTRRRLSYAKEVLPSTSNVQDHDSVADYDHVPEKDYIERICFNLGREIYVFDYNSNITSSTDSPKPVDKRVYKGTFPTCHDFKQTAAMVNACSLLVGFSAGQIQLVDPTQKEVATSKLFNEDRQIDKTAVTCLKWVPGENSLFAASHISGNLYFYNEDIDLPQVAPTYQVIRQGDSHTVYSYKSKIARNPIQRWQIGKGAINKFEFSGADTKLMATVSQDGLMRIFNCKTMDMVGFFKSYFGGLLCLAWSPDFQYIVTGGEDDLLTLYSVTQNRVICRGQGHKSWIAEVAFDTHLASPENDLHNMFERLSENHLPESNYPHEYLLSKELSLNKIELQKANSSLQLPKQNGRQTTANTSYPDVVPFDASTSFSNHAASSRNSFGDANFSTQSRLLYRIGTVGHDCQLCLWDISEDLLSTVSAPFEGHQQSPPVNSPSPCELAEQFPNNARNTTVIPIGIGSALTIPVNELGNKNETSLKSATDKDGNLANKGTGSRFKRLHKRGFSLGSRLAGNSDRWNRQTDNAVNGIHSVDGNGTLRRGEQFFEQLYGTMQCPKVEEVPSIEPLICKKVSHERLGSLHFREDCIVTACQEGLICTWARPNHARQDVRQLEKGNVPEGGGNNCHPYATDNCNSCV